MTIWNFDWAYFWETANYVSWYEYLAMVCFGFGWWFSVKNSIRTKQTLGKSFSFLWLVVLGCCLGICHHLFVNLNFKIFFYVVVLYGAVSDYCVCRRVSLEQNIEERKKIIAGRGDRDWSYGNDVDRTARGREHKRRHKGGARRYSKIDERKERLEGDGSAVKNLNIEEIQFDDVKE